MTLSALIRKRDTRNLATAIPAISATQPKTEAATVARIATVAVANPLEAKADPIQLSGADESTVRRWLAYIAETDPVLIAVCLNQCRTDPDALAYYLGRAEEVPADDRRYCRQCLNLTAGNKCRASKVSPIADLPQRCEDYSPGADDLDRRSGLERWPGLDQTQAKGETEQ